MHQYGSIQETSFFLVIYFLFIWSKLQIIYSSCLQNIYKILIAIFEERTY